MTYQEPYLQKNIHMNNQRSIESNLIRKNSMIERLENSEVKPPIVNEEDFYDPFRAAVKTSAAALFESEDEF